MSFPHSRHSGPATPFVRVNGKIRAREVRVVGEEGKQLGILPLSEAISLARSHGVDLVEIAPNATPPVCRIVDFGKFKYEQAKKEKETKKHQHANRVKELQLSPHIDAHDFSVKLAHTVDFLCEDMKVKVTLKFRGREMAHQEFGFQQINRLVQEVAPWGHPDFTPKLAGRSIHVMISPLPRNKRAKHPRGDDYLAKRETPAASEEVEPSAPPPPRPTQQQSQPQPVDSLGAPGGFTNNPFAAVNLPQ